MSLVDFDRLKEWLKHSARLAEEVEHLRTEMTVLRQDYLQRIGGMVKAIAATERRPESWESALAYLEGLPTLSAEELIGAYRKVSARFRDAFPASFGLLRGDRHHERKARKDLTTLT